MASNQKTIKKYEGTNILVTGGASGLGRSIVVSCAEAGARVIIADRDQKLGTDLEEKLVAKGHHVKFVFVDLTSISSQVDMLRNALAWLPQQESLHSLILSAGINGNTFDLSPESPSALNDESALKLLAPSASTLQVNLVSVLQTVQLAVKFGMGLEAAQLHENQTTDLKDKSITLIGSLAGYRALPRAADYSAAKWGVRGIFRSLRQQLPQLGVRINMVAPSFVRTPLLTQIIPMYEKMGVEFAEKETVVAAVNDIVSNESCVGRAFGVSSEGFVDLNDGPTGSDGCDVIRGLVCRGALGKKGSPMVDDEVI